MSHFDCPECPSLHAEIARLRAEAKRLKPSETCQYYGCRLGKPTDPYTQGLERERDEALAQVAILLRRLREEHCQSETCDLHTASYAEARVLLDRLQQVQTERAKLAEDCGEMRKQITRQLIRLQRAEAVVEAAKQFGDAQTWGSYITDGPSYSILRKALAAWEEGKA